MDDELQKSNTSVEANLISTVKGKILTFDEFKDFRNSIGFTRGIRGTFWLQDRSAYLYTKGQHIAPTLEDGLNFLAMARYLTSQGILYPQTEWGIYRDDEDQYALFAITRRLRPITSREETNPPEGYEVLDIIPGVLGGGGKTVDQWLGHLQLSFDTPRNGHNLRRLINPWEACHKDNWGWSQDGHLFPIDVEVIELKGREDFIRAWAQETPDIRNLIKEYNN
jgi:hypothetical protein